MIFCQIYRANVGQPKCMKTKGTINYIFNLDAPSPEEKRKKKEKKT